MPFQMERLQTICTKLKNQCYSQSVSIEDYKFTEGRFHQIGDLPKDGSVWKNFKTGELWGGRDCHGWFKTSVRVPGSFANKTIALVFYTFEEGWDAVNPQFFLYLNGRLIQGLDMNHREVIISEQGEGGVAYDIDLHAYAGMLSNKKSTLNGCLVSLEQDVRALYYDIQVPLWACEKLEAGDKRRIDMLAVLNEGVNRIDFRDIYSLEYYRSIEAARNYLSREFYEKLCGQSGVSVTCVGHTHIDVAWKWTVEQTREKAGRSFATALKLMEQYPEFTFMASQPQVYQFVKEDYPDLYQKIKERIKEGRWEGEGSMWLEADCNVTSGESLIRQLIHGKRFYKEEFGIDSKILWLPDVFGYSAALPQILKKAGVDYFITSKISKNQFNRMPCDTFMWRGIDGTEVLTYFITAKTPVWTKEVTSWLSTYNTEIHPGSIMGTWEEYKQKALVTELMVPFGFGDGGGGPTFEMLEIARRMAAGIPGIPKTKMGKTQEFITTLDKQIRGNKNLPTWVGELYFEYHRGTYTSMARNKRDNRRSEYTYQCAEKINTSAMLMGKPYPAEALEKGWKNILLNQFHDILPGSSIKDVYEVTQEEYKKILSIGNEEAGKGLEYLASRIHLQKDSIIVYNALSFIRDDIVEFEIPAGIKNPVLRDGDKILFCQSLGGGKALAFVQNIPANGYKAFVLEEAKGNIAALDGVVFTEKKIENRYFSIVFNGAMNIVSFYDKQNKRELLKKDSTGKQLQAFEDIPYLSDNWNIELYYKEKMWNIDDVQAVKILETGPVRFTLEITRRFNKSAITEIIYAYPDIAKIDIRCLIDWKQSQILLKTAFPIDINANEASYEIQYGNLTRPTHGNTSWDIAKFEVCGHSWADISESNFGVSLLNDSKYGYGIQDGVMTLTLLKSGIDPNPVTDQEMHQFTYSIYPHRGTWKNGKTQQMARKLNMPLLCRFEKAHGGELGESYSLASLDKDNVMIEVIKKAEDNDDVIIRLYEYQNARTQITLALHDTFKVIHECDLQEQRLDKTGENTNSISFEIRPYEIKTFRLQR
jgi:alpha-mannosidase